MAMRARRKQTRRSVGSIRTLGTLKGKLAIFAARCEERSGEQFQGFVDMPNICPVVETHSGHELEYNWLLNVPCLPGRRYADLEA
jgi:hypothetical protein